MRGELSLTPEGVLLSMRKRFALLLVLIMLFPLLPAAAEEPVPTMDPAAWASKSVGENDPMDFTSLTWDEIPPTIEGQHHYLLLCIDQWDRGVRPEGIDIPTYSSGAGGGRKDEYGNTDGIVILTLDTRAHRVMITSITRDTLIEKVNLSGDTKKYGRINRVFNDYGPEVLAEIISRHLGKKKKKYIVFTFRQIANIVDYMGGVQIELSADEVKALKDDVYPGTITSPNGVDITDLSRNTPGLYTFKTTSRAKARDDGKATGGVSAVLYMRIRKTGGDGDFMRTQRVRNVLSLLADKCRDMTLDDAKALVNNILDGNSNQTNITMNEALEAAEYAYGLRTCTIEEYRVPGEGLKRSHHFANMATWEVNWGRVREEFADYLQSSFLVADDEDEDDDF